MDNFLEKSQSIKIKYEKLNQETQISINNFEKVWDNNNIVRFPSERIEEPSIKYPEKIEDRIRSYRNNSQKINEMNENENFDDKIHHFKDKKEIIEEEKKRNI